MEDMVKRHFPVVLSICLTLGCACLGAQAQGVNRFNEELTSALESDAATILTRGMYVDFAMKVCGRLDDAASREMEREAGAWSRRNEPYVRASSAALSEIANRLSAAGGEPWGQAYFQMILDASLKMVIPEIRRVFNGAEADNAVAPLPEQCRTEATRLRGGSVDIQNSPNVTQALGPYMDKRGLGRY